MAISVLIYPWLRHLMSEIGTISPPTEEAETTAVAEYVSIERMGTTVARGAGRTRRACSKVRYPAITRSRPIDTRSHAVLPNHVAIASDASAARPNPSRTRLRRNWVRRRAYSAPYGWAADAVASSNYGQ